MTEAPSGLIRQRWVFSVLNTKLVLDRYHHERRHSRSQNFKTTKFYDRHQEGEEYGDWIWLSEDEVPWDEAVRADALAVLAARYDVVKASEI